MSMRLYAKEENGSIPHEVMLAGEGEGLVRQILEIIYPVGSLKFQTNATNPAVYLGFGTWVPWGEGRVPVSVDVNQAEFNATEKTGGAKTHTLTTAQMPSHNHLLLNTPEGPSLFPAYAAKDNGATGDTAGTGYGSATTFAGSGTAHNNLQPYITCYMWKRVA